MNLNILLLSGGMGKRLWPITNGQRGKQYIKFLKRSDGEVESMIQRIFRQLQSCYPNVDITIVTNMNQVSTIKEQLGERVDIVIEPEPRDTYPAIMLGCAYLYYVKKKVIDDTVIVMPVDTFTEENYYLKFAEMEKALSKNNLQVVLLGVCSQNPSNKYGYILPKLTEDSMQIYQVEKFIEKPNRNQAEELIKQGAVWNSGVFAFKLSYFCRLSNRINYKMQSYENIIDNFSVLKKRSFDYEVLEDENEIGMCRYDGTWSDLGTWDDLIHSMSNEQCGKVILSKELANTSVLNYLQLPIIVNGINNAIIVANENGILILDREKAADVKSIIENEIK